MTMQIETWFPLAVGFEDLSPPPEIKAGMLRHLEPWIAAHCAQGTDAHAWTGDRSGFWQLHREPAFDWIRGEVQRHAIEFARVLGANLSVLGFYFQRSWPVISRRGEQVARHSHPNASLSAVYYLQTPEPLERAGRLVFHNEADQNSLGRGFGLRDTGGIREWNPLNYQSTGYVPREGRLVVFPARQAHSAEPNQNEELRISLAFDIALVCSRLADPGRHEFLLPPPEEWTEFTPEVRGTGGA